MVKKLAVAFSLFLSGCGVSYAAGLDRICINGGNCEPGTDQAVSQSTPIFTAIQFPDGTTQYTAAQGGGGNGLFDGNGFSGGQSTHSINMRGYAIINASAITTNSPGPLVIGSSNPAYIVGMTSRTLHIGGTMYFQEVNLTSTHTYQFSAGSITVNGIYISTQNSQLVPFFGYNSIGVSTNVVAVTTSPLNQIALFSQDASSPTNHVTVRAWIPKGRSLYRSAILRDFEVVLASAVGDLQSFDNTNVTYAVTFATYSSIISVGTATYSNPNNVTVTGGSAPGGIRRITDQTLNGITALVGNGGCWLSAKITTAHGNVSSGWLGMVIEFFDYQ